jgi:threonine dehydratase
LFISPYSHPDVIAGAGTVALEIIDERPDVDTFVVPIGGGGLISGIGIAAETIGAAVVGVEVEASNPFTRLLAAGRIVEIDAGPTLADGLAGNMDPDTITFDLVRRYVNRIVVVGEADLEAAVGSLVREERLVAEGAGAAGVAAVLSSGAALQGRSVAVILSGANIDPEKLRALLGGT